MFQRGLPSPGAAIMEAPANGDAFENGLSGSPDNFLVKR